MDVHCGESLRCTGVAHPCTKRQLVRSWQVIDILWSVVGRVGDEFVVRRVRRGRANVVK